MGHQFLSRNFKTPSWLAYVKVVQPYCILKLIIAIGWGQFSYEIISGGVYSYDKYKVTKFSCKHSPLEHSKRSLPNRRHFCDTTTSFLTKKSMFSLNFSSAGKGPFMDGKAKNIYFSKRGGGGTVE